MPLGRLITTVVLITTTIFAAQFKEYYRGGEPSSVQPQTPPKAPQPAVRATPKATPRVAPKVQTPPQNAPVVRQRVVARIPSFYFGWTGNFFVRASAGFVRQDRSVSVKTINNGDAVYYKPKNHFMGTANGSKLTYDTSELFFRPQIGVGYQLINEGNFWSLDYYNTGDVSELLFNYAFTFPQRRIATAIPYVKLIGGVGHTDSEGFSPTTFSLGVGVGAYHYIDRNSKFRLEYGVDYSRREWLPIKHSYGNEDWIDHEAHLYMGAAYKF